MSAIFLASREGERQWVVGGRGGSMENMIFNNEKGREILEELVG